MVYAEEVAYNYVAFEDQMPDSAPDEDQAGMTKETIRTYFPETWIWELVSIG